MAGGRPREGYRSSNSSSHTAAGHGFLNDREAAGDRTPLMVKPMAPLLGLGPEPASAQDARRRIIEFFGAHLGHAAAPPGQ